MRPQAPFSEATVNNSGNSQVAVATDASPRPGATAAATWTPSVSGSSPVAAHHRPHAGKLRRPTRPPRRPTRPPRPRTRRPRRPRTPPPRRRTRRRPPPTRRRPRRSPVEAVAPPSTPPVEICGDQSILAGPSSPPAGAVTVPAGNNSSLSLDHGEHDVLVRPGNPHPR